ncbi:MAG TPA: hypothetical protein VFV43_05680, partial [Limnobacter sp.]|nr:hypothetical protein [Limnobacter sp.]
VRDFVANQQQEERSMRLPQFKIQSAPVPKSLYQEYAATLARLSPVVQVSSSGDSLQVSIADASHYAEFMFVLNSIQGVSDRVIWRAQEICLAGCEGTAAKAVIKGLTESVDVTLRGENDD